MITHPSKLRSYSVQWLSARREALAEIASDHGTAASLWSAIAQVEAELAHRLDPNLGRGSNAAGR
jgi:hypothetical protein